MLASYALVQFLDPQMRSEQQVEDFLSGAVPVHQELYNMSVCLMVDLSSLP